MNKLAILLNSLSIHDLSDHSKRATSTDKPILFLEQYLDAAMEIVDIATNYIPQSGKVFEAWLVDDAFEGSGYALDLGKILATVGKASVISWANII